MHVPLCISLMHGALSLSLSLLVTSASNTDGHNKSEIDFYESHISYSINFYYAQRFFQGIHVFSGFMKLVYDSFSFTVPDNLPFRSQFIIIL